MGKMSEIRINDLPNEVLIEIFKRVGSDSLNNAILTCKLWKQLVECSCTWPLILHRNNYNEQWINCCQTTNRQFHTIDINGLVLSRRNTILIEIFKRLGFKVAKLVLTASWICLDMFDLFVEMIACLPNLEHVIFNGVTIIGDGRGQYDLPLLIKLKILEIAQITHSFSLCFRKSQLKTLTINDSSNVHPNESIKAITDLLKSQQQLTTFALRDIDYETYELFRSEIPNDDITFQLTKLSLLDIELRESQNDYKNLVTFLKHHAKTINELELGRKFPNFIYELVFIQFKNLNSLQLMINELPKEMTFYMGLEENRSISNLVIMDSPPINVCPPWLKEFIRHVPNITNLTLLENCGRETVMFMAKNFTKLQKLAVKYFNGFFFGDVHFPQLTTLNIHKLNFEIDWDRFTKDNSQITELSIEIVDDIDALQCYDVKRIMKNLRLHTLKIGRNFYPSSVFFDHIRQNCSEIKKLYFHEVCNYISTIDAEDDEDKEDNKQPQERFGDVPGLRFCDNATYCMATSSKGTQFWDDDDEMDFDVNEKDYYDEDSDGESMISDNDGESMISNNDGESIFFDNDEENMISDNDEESLTSDNGEESMTSGNDGESIISDNKEESMSSGNAGESVISDNGGESIISDNMGENMISDSERESIISDSEGESIISDIEGDSMISDYDGNDDDDFDEDTMDSC